MLRVNQLIGFGAARARSNLWNPFTYFGSHIKVAWDVVDAANVALSGSNITQLNDLSGNAHHGTSASTKQPTRVTVSDYGSRNAALFDGVNDYISTRGWALTQPITMIAAYRTAATVSDAAVILAGANSASTRLVANIRSSGAGLDKPFVFAGSNVTSSNTVLVGNTCYIDVLVANAASSFRRFNGNAASPSTFSPSTAGLVSGVGISDAGEWASGGGNLAGHVIKYFIIDQALTQTECEKFEGWMAWEIGRQADLPGGHPYSAAPPTV